MDMPKVFAVNTGAHTAKCNDFEKVAIEAIMPSNT